MPNPDWCAVCMNHSWDESCGHPLCPNKGRESAILKQFKIAQTGKDRLSPDEQVIDREDLEAGS